MTRELHRLVATLPALLLLAACSTTKVMDGIMASWVGAPIEQVRQQWGYPDETREFEGRKLYVWHHEKSAYLPGQVNASVTTTGNTTTASANSSQGVQLHGVCTRILEVDLGGLVRSWEWRGNNCPFAEMLEYKHWRRR